MPRTKDTLGSMGLQVGKGGGPGALSIPKAPPEALPCWHKSAFRLDPHLSLAVPRAGRGSPSFCVSSWLQGDSLHPQGLTLLLIVASVSGNAEHAES